MPTCAEGQIEHISDSVTRAPVNSHSLWRSEAGQAEGGGLKNGAQRGSSEDEIRRFVVNEKQCNSAPTAI